jgi:hypothetical protein
VRKLTVEALADALTQATTDAKMIDRAQAVGEQIRTVRSPASPRVCAR